MKFYLCDIRVKYDGVSEPFYFPQIYDFFMIRLIFTESRGRPNSAE